MQSKQSLLVLKHALKKRPWQAPRLTSVNLAGNRIGDKGALAKIFTKQVQLRYLCLSDNEIGTSGAFHISEAILRVRKSLTHLDLSRNNINGEGAAAVAAAIMRGKALENVNIAFNAFGKCENRIAVRSLARCLKRHQSLMHLDISNNRLSSVDCEVIGKALEQNRILRGLHVQGNDGYVDARGFLCKGGRWGDNVRLHLQLPPPSDARINCWICEKWAPAKFVWTAKSMGHQFTQQQVIDIRKAWLTIDEDQSDNLSYDEVERLMSILGHHLEEEQIAQLFKAHDLDGSGRIEYNPEFLRMMSTILRLELPQQRQRRSQSVSSSLHNLMYPSRWR